jgi:hypothetical protein
MRMTVRMTLFPCACNWHGPCCVMQLRIDDTTYPGDAHEHPLYQTHDIRSRSRNERPHYGWRRISICTAGTPAFVGDLFRSPARRASMVDVALLLRRVATARNHRGPTAPLSLGAPTCLHRRATHPALARHRRVRRARPWVGGTRRRKSHCRGSTPRAHTSVAQADS